MSNEMAPSSQNKALPLLVLDRVSKTFRMGRGKALAAVRNVSLAVHPGEIEVMLINRGFFVKGSTFRNDLCHRIGKTAVAVHIAAYKQCVRTKAAGQFHRHTRTHAE